MRLVYAGWNLFLVCKGAALLVVVTMIVLRARATGIPARDALTLCLWSIPFGFAVSHAVSLVLYEPVVLLDNPLEIFRIWGSMASYGGFIGAVGAALVVMRRRRTSRAETWQLLDAVAFSFPFAWTIARAGCVSAKDHPGIHSTSWLAVQYPDGRRLDLGLLELLFVALVAILFLLLDRRPRPRGFFCGVLLSLYGIVRLGLDYLRVADLRYLGWTPAQYFSVIAACFGMMILANLRGYRLRESS